MSQNGATETTKQVLDAAREYYAFDDRADFDDVDRGLIAELPDGGLITNADGLVVWNLPEIVAKVQADASDTVHPSQWRQAQLISHAGLYEVVPGIYQVRNHDIANVTFVETEDSVVVIDTGLATECADVARDLYFAHRPAKPISAVIYTHTHVDHWGGVAAFASREDVASGKISIIAPGVAFDRLALSENIQAGNVMGRRAAVFFGELLPISERGFVTCGIGTANPIGTPSYIPPTDIITETGQTRVIGGITFEFQYAPDTEAPEEMHIWIPEYKALTCAENANHSLHNIQTLRGARTRDAANFSHYLDEAIDRYGDEVEVHFGMHTWPVWGNEKVREFLSSQRDAYKFIHDEALRLANHGYRPAEIAERMSFPRTLDRAWWNRGYHGTLNHDAKAVFAKELGWFGGNLATLYPHPDGAAAPRYVEQMGGADTIITAGRRAYDDGDYRWVVQMLDHLVTAQPENTEAKNLQADAYEQLGYQAEGPQWRNAFLTAAQELRNGINRDVTKAEVGIDMVLGMPLELLFDYAGVELNGAKAADHPARINLTITDIDGEHAIEVVNGVLYYRTRHLDDADATLTLPHQALAGLIFQPTMLPKLETAGAITIDGNAETVRTLFGMFDTFDSYFPIVTPID